MGCISLDILEREYAPMKIVYGGKYGRTERVDFYRQGTGNVSGNLRVVYRVLQSSGGWLSNKWNALVDWWNNSEMYFEAGGDVSIGIQAGAGVRINDAKINVSGNLISTQLLSGAYRQSGSSYGPETYEGYYIGKGNKYNIKQGVSVLFLGYEHGFQLDGGRYIYGTETHQYNIGPATFDNNAARIKIGVDAALILGISGSIEFGFRRK